MSVPSCYIVFLNQLEPIVAALATTSSNAIPTKVQYVDCNGLKPSRTVRE